MTRMHLWPLGSDMFWFAASQSLNGDTTFTLHTLTNRDP